MASLNMNGPFNLDVDQIDKQITKISPGNYALGRIDGEGTFRVRYVGRADSNLNQRLKSWVNKTNSPKFKYSYASSPKSAFEEECRNYHDFEPPENDIHPDTPSGINRPCPICDQD